MVAPGDQTATSATTSAGRLVAMSEGDTVETFSLTGTTSGLDVTVSSGGAGQTLSTIISGAGGDSAHSVVEAAMRFGASRPLSPSSASDAHLHTPSFVAAHVGRRALA